MGGQPEGGARVKTCGGESGAHGAGVMPQPQPQYRVGISNIVSPGNGCSGMAGSWHSRRHTTGAGMARLGGSQGPGAQGPGGSGAQGKGKASGGRLSSRGPRGCSCKGSRHRLGMFWGWGGTPELQSRGSPACHPLTLPMDRRYSPRTV